MTHRPHSLTACATSVIAVTLALGVLLPGSRPSGRERPLRRAARTGYSARSVGSGVWVVPDQEIHGAAPGSASGDRDADQTGHPDGAHDPPPELPAALFSPDVSLTPVHASPAVPSRFRLSPSAGRAPPALRS